APNTSGGYVYLRKRGYDTRSGGVLGQDPIGLAGGVNLYAYAGNNPTAYTDPFGLCPDKAKDGMICFDLFIMKKRTSVGFRGDGRVHDPAAAPSDSRVQILIDPSSLKD